MLCYYVFADGRCQFRFIIQVVRSRKWMLTAAGAIVKLTKPQFGAVVVQANAFMEPH